MVFEHRMRAVLCLAHKACMHARMHARTHACTHPVCPVELPVKFGGSSTKRTSTRRSMVCTASHGLDLPRHLQDSERRLPVLLGRAPTMTRRKCSMLARRDGYRYAGVQFGIECWGGEYWEGVLAKMRLACCCVAVTCMLCTDAHQQPHPLASPQATTWPAPCPGVLCHAPRPAQATRLSAAG